MESYLRLKICTVFLFFLFSLFGYYRCNKGHDHYSMKDVNACHEQEKQQDFNYNLFFVSKLNFIVISSKKLNQLVCEFKQKKKNITSLYKITSIVVVFFKLTSHCLLGTCTSCILYVLLSVIGNRRHMKNGKYKQRQSSVYCLILMLNCLSKKFLFYTITYCI